MFLLRNRRDHQTAHRRDVEYGRCLPQASVTMGMSYHVIDRAGGAMAAFKLITAGGARLVLLTLLLVVATQAGPGRADDGGAIQDTLGKLEDRFFEHEYQTDSISARLERLEKMVFGEARTGSNEQRLKELQQAIPAQPSTAEQSPAAPPASAAPSQQAPAGDAQAAGGGTAPAAAGADQDAETAGTDYPSVTALEQQLLGKTYADQPIRKRLDRLETKAFGRPSGIDDLSVRVAKLQEFAHPATAVNSGSEADNEEAPPATRSGWVEEQGAGQAYSPPGQSTYNAGAPAGQPYGQSYGQPYGQSYGEPAYGGGSPASGSPSGSDTGLEPQVSSMENQVFGRTYPSLPITDRVNNLEVSVFSNESPQSNLPLPE